ncbi:stage II sporulation protein M [Lachnospiraceae bacterium KK002]
MKKLWRMSWQQKGISEHESLWIKVMKIALLVSFVAGIFAANLMGHDMISNAGVLNDYFIEKFQYTQVNGENLFFYIVGERLPLLFLLFVLLFTALGIPGGILVLGWQGFSIGFMLSIGIAKYGVKGILLVLGGLFPQYLFYIPVYVFCFCLAVFIRQRFCRGNEGGFPERKLMYGMGLLAMGALLAVFLTGIFLESYVNPMILRQILKIF